MTKHIDRQREALLKRRDEILDLPTYGEQHEAELDELNAALGKLDEVARLGTSLQYPRLKVRKIDAARLEVLGLKPEHLDRWLVTIRHEDDDETEQVLGSLDSLGAAYSAATEYVAVQRFLADRIGGAR